MPPIERRPPSTNPPVRTTPPPVRQKPPSTSPPPTKRTG